MQVGTTKDQGLYNKPSAAVHPRALAVRTLPQYNTVFTEPTTGYYEPHEYSTHPPVHFIVTFVVHREAHETKYIYGNIEAHSCHHCWSGKVISITYYECVFLALSSMQCSCAMLSSMAFLALQYFFFHISQM